MKKADHIFYNGVVYTVDQEFTTVSAFAVLNGMIIAVGTDEEMLAYESDQKTDLKGKFVYPGFHDGHCHFYGYGIDQKKIWLTGTKSFEEILDTLQKYRDKQTSGWIIGRGWDQNDWSGKKYPDKSALDIMFPETPVFLLRIDGHAALVNRKALSLAGIDNSTQVTGGVIDQRQGKLTGILIDAAVDIVYKVIPSYSRNEQADALLTAQKQCFEVGLTSVTDAGYESNGLTWDIISLIDSLQKDGRLKMRINAMASIEETGIYKSIGKYKTPSLSVQGFKIYADGALGSRGACLLQPYADQPGHYGFLIHSPEWYDSIAGEVASMRFQLNTHCIGDSAHRLMLQLYEKHLSGYSDHRWRIEHAQVINPADLEYYGRNKILPSVQPTHATSDMYWAPERLGTERMKGAYAYKDLLLQNGILISGSDFPVESINPLFGIYAAVARKDQSGFPENGFQMDNALSREEALRSFTIWPSYGAFTENEKGSLEPGKVADFVILENDIMTIPEREIWQTKVKATYISGQPVFQRGE